MSPLFVAACAWFSGCSKTPKSPVITVIQSTGGTEYWNRFLTTARDRAGRYGFVLKWAAPQSPADYEVQAKLLNDAVQRHVDGIIIAPSHQLVLAEGVRRAYAEGIPVVVVDAPVAVQPSEYVTQIGCSDEAMGFLAAQRLTQLGGLERVLTVGSSRHCRPQCNGKTLCGARCSALHRTIASCSRATVFPTGRGLARRRWTHWL